MKNKIIFLVCAVFLTVACEKEQHTGKRKSDARRSRKDV